MLTNYYFILNISSQESKHPFCNNFERNFVLQQWQCSLCKNGWSKINKTFKMIFKKYIIYQNYSNVIFLDNFYTFFQHIDSFFNFCIIKLCYFNWFLLFLCVFFFFIYYGEYFFQTVELSFDFPFYGSLLRNVTIATGGNLFFHWYILSVFVHSDVNIPTETICLALFF